MRPYVAFVATLIVTPVLLVVMGELIGEMLV
jgi:hypothetical protein